MNTKGGMPPKKTKSEDVTNTDKTKGKQLPPFCLSVYLIIKASHIHS